MGIFDTIELIKKNFISIFVILVLVNIYPLYKYIELSFSSNRILTIEIAPVNELELNSLRELETKILNSKKMIESSYFNRELNLSLIHI